MMYAKYSMKYTRVAHLRFTIILHSYYLSLTIARHDSASMCLDHSWQRQETCFKEAYEQIYALFSIFLNIFQSRRYRS